MGWLGKRPVNATTELAGLTTRVAPDSWHVASGDAYALRVQHGDATRIYASDDVVSAITGTPRWADHELRAVAASEGHAAALAHGYRRFGAEVLQRLRGDFALAILDPRSQKALLAIDRLGVQPLAYTSIGGTLFFGSTTDELGWCGPIARVIDPNSVYAFVYFHMVPSPWTIYAQAQKIVPAQAVHYASGRLSSDFYWTPDFQRRSESSVDALEQQAKDILRDAVARIAPTSNTGAFLSGGIDSSTLAGVLGLVLGQPTRTYSIGFAAHGYDEMAYARLVASHFSTKHHEYYVTPADVTSAVQMICAAYEEPFGNSSVVPAYYCARMAREDGADLMVAGDGGDELFAGNERYATQKLFELYSWLPSGRLKTWFEAVALHLPASERIAVFRKIKRYIAQAKTPLPDRYQSYNFLERVSPTSVFATDFLASVDTSAPLRLFRDTYAQPNTDSTLDRSLFLDWKFTLADNDLRKVSKACELAGIPVCYPFLDDDLVSFSTCIPPDLKLKGTQLRYFFKKAMSDFLPVEVLRKTKHGFGLPFGLWLRTDTGLQHLAYDSLTDLKTTHYFRPDFIDDLIDLHRRDHPAFYGGVIWVLMSLALWLRAHAA